MTIKINVMNDLNAMNYAYQLVRDTNHQYDGGPYTIHLNMIKDVANEFIHLIPEEDRENVLAACWLHDSIEDHRQTYNDIKKVTNETVAEIVYALTNEKGKNRKERANDKYYQGIRRTPYAVFVKCCDRIANAIHSKETKSKMWDLYKKEYPEFYNNLHEVGFYEELWDNMEKLFILC